jgi:enamine deaminase RidA (YjgF/YER057c/UK114 family)
MPDMNHRRLHRTGSRFEDVAGYSRAVRIDSFIAVSGTAATDSDGRALSPGNSYAQTRECIEHALAAVVGLGGSARDVIRTRLFLTREAEWEGAIRAHHEAFSDVLPANTTLYVAGFIPQGVLVEVEVDAVVSTDE